MSLVAPFGPEHSADPFGDWPQWRKDMGLGPHRGKDWNGLPAGTPIPASGDGTVTLNRWNGALGWEVVVYYPSAGVYLGYCHLLERGLALGSPVTTGTTVGRLGNTGSASAGNHLHQTASWVNGDPGLVPVIDPMQFFDGSRPAGEGFTPITNGADDMSATILSSPIGKSLVIDGILAVGKNTPEEFAAVQGAQQVTISAEQHRSYLTTAAHRDGLPLIVYVDGEQGVYIREGGKLTLLRNVNTLAQLHTLGAPSITITPAERDAWL